MGSKGGLNYLNADISLCLSPNTLLRTRTSLRGLNNSRMLLSHVSSKDNTGGTPKFRKPQKMTARNAPLRTCLNPGILLYNPIRILFLHVARCVLHVLARDQFQQPKISVVYDVADDAQRRARLA